jgi:hypothetical protein
MSTPVRLFTLLVLGAALPALGDDSLSGLSVGARVRLTAPSVSRRPLVGQLVRESAALEIRRDDGSSASVPIRSIEKLQVSSGRKRKTLVGAVCGAALGVGTALITLRCKHPGFCEDNYINAGLVVFGGGGAVVGALVGTAIRTEHWKTVPVPIARPAGAAGGNLLSLTLRF